MYKYTILTFIIGKGYLKLRLIINKQLDVLYLAITDDLLLKSNTWKVIYDKDLLNIKNNIERCLIIRYNVFKYCTTNICVTIDGSVQIKGSLDKLINKFNNLNYDIGLVLHYNRNKLDDEIKCWNQCRNYSLENINNFLKFLNDANYDLNFKGLYCGGCIIRRKNKINSDIDKLTYTFLKKLNKDENDIERIDQVMLSYVINTYFKDINILPMSFQIFHSNVLQLCKHNSNIPIIINFNLNIPDKKYLLNKEVLCYYLT